jgi:hypothetical protein
MAMDMLTEIAKRGKTTVDLQAIPPRLVHASKGKTRPRHYISFDTIRYCIERITKCPYLAFGDEFVEQLFGLPMGSCWSPVLCARDLAVSWSQMVTNQDVLRKFGLSSKRSVLQTQICSCL